MQIFLHAEALFSIRSGLKRLSAIPHVVANFIA